MSRKEVRFKNFKNVHEVVHVLENYFPDSNASDLLDCVSEVLAYIDFDFDIVEVDDES